jgi:hypothetical protein
MNFKARELRFCLKDKSQFNEEALKKALKAEGFRTSGSKPGRRRHVGPLSRRRNRGEHPCP